MIVELYAAQSLTAKLNGRKDFYFERLCLLHHPSQQGITCSKLAAEAQE